IIDKDGGFTEATTIVVVNNVAPTATLDAPASVDEGAAFTVALGAAFDPSSVDTQAGFSYAFDCGDGNGYGDLSPAPSRSCSADDNGTRTLRAKIQDQNGGVSEYTQALVVNNVAPTATFSGGGPVPEGGTTKVTFTGAFDPSPVDTAAGLHYAVACDGGSLA